MIIPFLDGLLTFSRAPITWILLMTNVFFFAQNYQLSKTCQQRFEKWYDDSHFMYVQGQTYAQFQSRKMASMARTNPWHNIKEFETMGRLSLKDNDYLNVAAKANWVGDDVAIEDWRLELTDFLSLRDVYPPFILGLSAQHKDSLAYLSYQFYHESFSHLLGNLLLVLLIGAYLERRTSGYTIFIVYILGGAVSACLLNYTVGLTAAPLIGASGSLCALLGFLMITEWKTKTKLFYIFLPIKHYMGFTRVRTAYWVILLFVIEDIAGWLAQTQFTTSGVSHAIHLYGFFVGVLLGFLYQQSIRWGLWVPRKNYMAYRTAKLQRI